MEKMEPNLHDEQPSPSRNTVTSIESQATGGNEATKSTAHHLEHEQSGKTLAKLVLCVPCTEEVDDTGKEDGLGDTKEDTNSQKTCIALNSCSQCAYCTPNNSGGADVFVKGQPAGTFTERRKGVSSTYTSRGERLW